MKQAECIVIGAGVIGLACARELALKGFKVLVIERHPNIGMETSSRHSEVIHGIIHFPADSQKSKFCVQGNKQLYAYCQTKKIPFKRMGKLIVATEPDELEVLEDMLHSGIKNGVEQLSILDQTSVHELEPELKAVGALYSPTTGIIDTQSYMAELAKDILQHGGNFLLNTEFLGADVVEDGIIVRIKTDAKEVKIFTLQLVNCAGLYATKVACKIAGIPEDEIPTTYLRKGNYFKYNGANPFKRLIYPVPVAGGLGTHCTIDMQGGLRFGPDVQRATEVEYSVDVTRRAQFFKDVQRYWPGVQEDLLEPAYAGIRPILCDKPGVFRDFVVRKHRLEDTCAQIIGLYGIESPGVTSSLAIGKHVAKLVTLNKLQPDPYEITKLGGHWLGTRSEWSVASDLELRLETFSSAIWPLTEYAQNCLHSTYPNFGPRNPNRHEVETAFLILNHNKRELIGYRVDEIDTVTKTCDVTIYCDPLKMDQATLYRELKTLQSTYKDTPDHIKSIRMTVTLPPHAAPVEQKGLHIVSSLFGEYCIECAIDAVLPGEIDAAEFVQADVDLTRFTDEYLYIAERVQDLKGICLTIRDETNAILGITVVSEDACITDVAHINLLYLAPELRGAGHGKALIQEIERQVRASGFRNLRVGTAEYMAPDFYRKQGYTQTFTAAACDGLYYMFNKKLLGDDATHPEPEVRSPTILQKLRVF